MPGQQGSRRCQQLAEPDAAMTEGARKPTDHLYWARSQSIATPVEIKPLDKEAAAALEQAAAAKRGAAWNAASTWEEKDISKWAHELLSETLLPSIVAEFDLSSAEAAKLPAELQGMSSLRCSLKVASVTSTTGDVTHVLSRGKQRVVFELALKLLLELEIRQGSELKHILTGTLNITEVSVDFASALETHPERRCTTAQFHPLQVSSTVGPEHARPAPMLLSRTPFV
jgi:hypothetical protein